MGSSWSPENRGKVTLGVPPKWSAARIRLQFERILVVPTEENRINLVLTHSNQKEIEHPNTPASVKKAAGGMIFTLEVGLNPKEQERKTRIHVLLTGNGKPEKYAADATHVFEAGKYGGYFITTDDRILIKRDELRNLSGAVVLKPTEWLKVLADADAV